MLRVFLERLLAGTTGLATVGIAVKIGAHHRILFARLSNVLSDGQGPEMALGWRGAASIKPCWKRSNVLRKGSELVGRRPGFVEVTCVNPHECKVWSGNQVHFAVNSLAEAARRVGARALTQAKYSDLEMSLGINYSDRGLLASQQLRFLDGKE